MAGGDQFVRTLTGKEAILGQFMDPCGPLRTGPRGLQRKNRQMLRVNYCIEANPQAITIGIEGYGECGSTDAAARPIYLEHHEGKLTLYVWADINNEEPTHVIELAGAKHEHRKPDDQPAAETAK